MPVLHCLQLNMGVNNAKNRFYLFLPDTFRGNLRYTS